MSRLQALVFTFIVAALFVIFSIDIGNFVEIPESVLGLLGIGGGTYLISKGISKEKKPSPPPEGDPTDRASSEPPAPPAPEGSAAADQAERIEAHLRSRARRGTWKV